MRFLEKKEKIESLFTLIENESAGTASNLADRLCVSLATVGNYLALLREDGHRIGYCTGRKTYSQFFNTKAVSFANWRGTPNLCPVPCNSPNLFKNSLSGIG
jgi:hypothetical protein